MADPARESVLPPFTTFNFEVEITVTGRSEPLCSAAFAECDGLEMSMQVKTIREGGNNNQPVHLLGPVSYGQLTLKRGMTDTFDLWDWFEGVLRREAGWFDASAQVILLAADGVTEQARFEFTGCRPVKLKAPALNAKDGLIAVEEMQIAYETMSIRRP
jgi:phage tail-like protein